MPTGTKIIRILRADEHPFGARVLLLCKVPKLTRPLVSVRIEMVSLAENH